MVLHRGKIAREPTVTNVRALTRDDLALIVEARSPTGNGTSTSAVARLRDSHHRIARLFAAGLRIGEIVERVGYSYNRVSTLQRDPAFQELIATYRGKVDAAFEREQDEYAKLTMSNMIKAETQLAEKLEEAEENGEFLPTRDLIAISRDAADRFGYGKRQTNLNVNADFASLLEKTIARSGKGGQPAPITIEGAVSRPSQSQSRAEVPAFDSGTESPPLVASLRRI